MTRNDSHAADAIISNRNSLNSLESDGHELDTIRPLQLGSPPAHRSRPSGTVEGYNRNISTLSSQAQNSPARIQQDNKFVIPSRPATLYREQSIEDYSNIFGENDSVIDERLVDKVRLLGKMSAVLISDTIQTLMRNNSSEAPQVAVTPRRHGRRSGGVKSHTRTASEVTDDEPTLRPTKSMLEIHQYAESEEDDDFSDILFEKDATLTQKTESDQESEDGRTGGLMLSSRLSTGSWLGDEDDEDDPFASVEGFDEMDMQANIARDKHARLQTLVHGLVSELKIGQPEEVLSDLSEQMVGYHRERIRSQS